MMSISYFTLDAFHVPLDPPPAPAMIPTGGMPVNEIFQALEK
jgi:hypothetical protein